jgi:3-deoxy-D-manno-octulosonic-acid transferase
LIALYCYRFLSILASPFVFLLILYRAKRGKEDFSRLKERFGMATLLAPGPVIWLHAASVGEALVALNLIGNLSQSHPKHQFLLTTGTVTSSQLVSQRKDASLIHQYAPIDVPYCVSKFLDHWQPKIAIFLESEIWPNMLHISKKKCPVLLVNARMSDRSYGKWSYCRSLLASCLKCFSFILAQSQQDCFRFSQMGSKTAVNLGNLKFCNTKPEVDSVAFEYVRHHSAGRMILLAASTHQGDEEFITQCYKSLKQKHKNLLLIIAPRHPSRAPQITKLLEESNLVLASRTLLQRINQETDVYLVDTIGELGLFFSLANISFIGGSLKNGGHSIIEPSFFKTLIIFGPDMGNFSQVASEYIMKNAALSFENLPQATAIIDRFLQSPNDVESYSLAARQILQDKKQILHNYLRYIERFI